MNTTITAIISSVFDCLRDQKYAVIKFSGLGHILPGNDIDIVCHDKYEVSRLIVSELSKLTEQGHEIHVTGKRHVHVDAVEGGEIFLRFDLIDDFSFLKKITVCSTFAQDLLDRRITQADFFQGDSYFIKRYGTTELVFLNCASGEINAKILLAFNAE